jgi:RimJ/RimL family protein N-acetyltransferase
VYSNVPVGIEEEDGNRDAVTLAPAAGLVRDDRSALLVVPAGAERTRDAGHSLSLSPTAAHTVRLHNGDQVRIRPIQRDDGPLMLQLMTHLDARSRRLRFFTAAANLTAAADWATSADGCDHVGLVALDAAGRLAGHAAFCRVYGRRAEVAVEISAGSRHQGLATMLIAELARRAEALGIDTFIAEVLPENRDMLAVFHDGFDARERREDGEVDIEFPTSAWRRAGHLHGVDRPGVTPS